MGNRSFAGGYMFLVVLGVANLAQASTETVPQSSPTKRFDQQLSENPAVKILGAYVNGELIKLQTQEDVDEFFENQDAYIEKVKQKITK
jgi:hypothetical protein